MALEDLSQEDLIVIVVEALTDTRLGSSVTHLLRLVHGDERVPSRVKDDDVKAALVIAVERGWVVYGPGDGVDGSAWVRSTKVGRERLFQPHRSRAEALGIPTPEREG